MEITDQDKIDFFDRNWKHLEKIIDIVQSEKFGYLKAGSNIFEWLSDFLEHLQKENK